MPRPGPPAGTLRHPCIFSSSGSSLRRPTAARCPRPHPYNRMQIRVLVHRGDRLDAEAAAIGDQLVDLGHQLVLAGSGEASSVERGVVVDHQKHVTVRSRAPHRVRRKTCGAGNPPPTSPRTRESAIRFAQQLLQFGHRAPDTVLIQRVGAPPTCGSPSTVPSAGEDNATIKLHLLRSVVIAAAQSATAVWWSSRTLPPDHQHVGPLGGRIDQQRPLIILYGRSISPTANTRLPALA